MVSYLRFDCVVIGWKSFAFEDNLISIFGWAVEGGHKEVEVGCQRFHYRYFTGKGANNFGALREGCIVDMHPRRDDGV